MIATILFILLGLASLGSASKFKNCDPNANILMDFSFPDPMLIKLGTSFTIKGSGLVRKTTPMKFKVKHAAWKQVFGVWIPIPCVGEGCYKPMPCEMFIAFGYNGTCPIPSGDYKDYTITVPVPYFPVPWWLTDGNYRFKIEGYTEDLSEMWFCGEMTQYFKQIFKSSNGGQQSFVMSAPKVVSPAEEFRHAVDNLKIRYPLPEEPTE